MLCSVDPCETPTKARQFCSTHYQRWLRHGSPDVVHPPGRPKTAAEGRILDKFEVGPDCWEWTAGTTSHGYGNFRVSEDSVVGAHRFVYEWLVGPISEGLELDHLCSNTLCINPDHLEPVTGEENRRREWETRKAVT